ncbi:hypothetical protein ACTXT7_005987 [Hymenolepis weldensis]
MARLTDITILRSIQVSSATTNIGAHQNSDKLSRLIYHQKCPDEESIIKILTMEDCAQCPLFDTATASGIQNDAAKYSAMKYNRTRWPKSNQNAVSYNFKDDMIICLWLILA